MAATPAPDRDGREPAVGSKKERRDFLQHNVLASGSTIIAGVLGLGLQAISSHALQPGQFGKVFAVYSFYTLVTRPSAAFGRLQAWQTSREWSTDGTVDVSGALLRQQTIWLLAGGTAIVLAFTAAGGVLGRYLHVPLSYIVVGGVSVPFLLAVQPLLGILQGERKFVPWSALSVLVNLSRLVLIAALMLPMGSLGFLLGNSLASIVTFLVCLYVVRRDLRSEGKFRWGACVPFMITGLVSTLAMGVFQGTDVIMVEHFFSKVPAGQYAAVASVGSSVFFASGGVSSVVFPMIASRHAQGLHTLRIMGAALALCVLAGGVGTAALALFGPTVLVDFAGRSYLAGTHYLALYGLGMALLAWVVVLINTLQSLNSLSLLWILVPATVMRPVSILMFHGSLHTVVVVSDLLIGAFAFVLSGSYLLSEWKLHRRHRSVDARRRIHAALGDHGAQLA